MAAEIKGEIHPQSAETPLSPNEILIEKAGFQMLQLRLKPETLLKGFDSPVLQGGPREYIQYLKNFTEIAADLIQVIESVVNGGSSLSDLEMAHFRETQIYILKKQKTLLEYIHGKIEEFLEANFGTVERILEEHEELAEIASDLSFFAAKSCPSLFDDLDYYTMELCRLKWCDLEKEDPLFNYVAEHELKVYQRDFEEFSEKHAEVLSHLTEDEKVSYESDFKETLKLRQVLFGTIFEPGALDLETPTLIPGMVGAYQVFKETFEALKKKGQAFISDTSDHNNPEKRQALSQFEKERVEFLAQIRRWKKEYENVNTIFHSELDYAGKVIGRLQRELSGGSARVVSAASGSSDNKAVNQAAALVETENDRDIKLSMARFMKDADEAIKTHNALKDHFSPALGKSPLPKSFLDAVIVDYEELIRLEEKWTELQAKVLSRQRVDLIDKNFSGLGRKILQTIREDRAFIEAAGLVMDDEDNKKKRPPAKSTKSKRKKKKKNNKKKSTVDPSGAKPADSKGQVSTPGTAQLAGSRAYSIEVTRGGVDVRFPPVPSKPAIPDEEESEEEEESKEKEDALQAGASEPGSLNREDQSTSGSSVDSAVPPSPPILPQQIAPIRTLRANAPAFIPSPAAPQDPELISESALSSSPDPMTVTPSTTPPSPSSAASLERRSIDLELEERKQEVDRLNSAISQGNSIVNDTAQRLRDLQLTLARSEAYQQEVLRRTQAMELQLQSMRNLHQQALYPVLFRVAPPGMVTQPLPPQPAVTIAPVRTLQPLPPQPVVIPASMQPLRFAPQIANRRVMVVRPFPPPQPFVPPPFPYYGQGNGQGREGPV